MSNISTSQLFDSTKNPSVSYYIFKSIMTGLELNLTGMGLVRFVQSSTGCTLQEFETVYEEIQDAWNK